MEIDCNKNIDEITLYIYDQNGDKIDKERYYDEDKFEYILNAVDEDETWFEIELDHNFNSNTIDCELNIDSTSFDFSFDENTDNKDLTIQRNYEESLEFTCERDIDEMLFKVYNDDLEKVYDKDYIDKDSITFDIDELEEKYELKIALDHNFGDDEITCTLEIDNIDYYTYSFDTDSTSDDLKIIREFSEIFEFDCDKDIDEMTLYIYDKNGDKIDTLNYDDEDRVNYELNKGLYDFLIQVENDFTTEVECELFIDGENTKDYNYDSKSGLRDLRTEDSFDEEIEFRCEEEINKLVFMVFENDDYNNGDVIYEKKYLNTKSFTYNINSNQATTIELEVIENQDNQTQINTTQNDNNIELIVIDNEDLNAQINKSLQSINNQDSKTNINELDSYKSSLDDDKKRVQEEQKSNEDNSNFFIVAFVIFFAIILVVIMFVIFKLDLLNSSQNNKSKKDKVDMSFLNKKK